MQSGRCAVRYASAMEHRRAYPAGHPPPRRSKTPGRRSFSCARPSFIHLQPNESEGLASLTCKAGCWFAQLSATHFNHTKRHIPRNLLVWFILQNNDNVAHFLIQCAGLCIVYNWLFRPYARRTMHRKQGTSLYKGLPFMQRRFLSSRRKIYNQINPLFFLFISRRIYQFLKWFLNFIKNTQFYCMINNHVSTGGPI